MLEQIAEHFWTVEVDMRLMGMEVGTRMSVIRLENGEIWLHSPVSANKNLFDEIDALGSVAHIVGPNQFHHLYLPQWIKRYPSAKIWAAPGLAEKRKDIAFTGTLHPVAAEQWPSEIQYKGVGGMPKHSETVFFHSRSKALICTDLLFWLPKPKGIFTAIYAWLGSCKHHPNQTPIFRSFIKDKEAHQKSIQEIIQWDFEIVSICHREIIRNNGKTMFQKYLL